MIKNLFLSFFLLAACLGTKDLYAQETLRIGLEKNGASYQIARSHFLPNYQQDDLIFEEENADVYCRNQGFTSALVRQVRFR